VLKIGIVLYCIVLYCIVLYCIVLYCIVFIHFLCIVIVCGGMCLHSLCVSNVYRAKNAYEAYKTSHNDTPPNFAVGLEGGVVYTDARELECFAWCAVYDGCSYGTARSSSFNLPKAISDLVDGGMELGDADDEVFRSTNAKQGGGTIGHLTRGLISRTQYYTPMVTLAFVPFQWPELYSPP
jgi:non-canonical (house-cleaning) NTP pyrophosphatase